MLYHRQCRIVGDPPGSKKENGCPPGHSLVHGVRAGTSLIADLLPFCRSWRGLADNQRQLKWVVSGASGSSVDCGILCRCRGVAVDGNARPCCFFAVSFDR